MISVKEFLASKNIHIVKRDNLSLGWRIGIRAIAIVSAFLLCAIFIAIAYQKSPIFFISSIFNGVFGSERRIWRFLFGSAILLGFSIALVPAFKMKYWNCGADGQALMGALACAGCMFYMGGKAPDAVIIIVALILSVLVAVIWAVIPAIFKAFFNTNETLFTLMMNYIATQFVLFFIKTWVTNGTGKLNPISYGNLPEIANKYLFPILVVAIITIIVAIYIKQTKHGFELSLVGESVNSAKYAGINVKWVIIRTMILSGIVAGLMGFILVAGYDHTVSDATTDGRGFTGIIVTWMAGMNPVFMVLASIFVVFIDCGTSQLLSDLNIYNDAAPDLIIGVFFFFIIGCEFFIRYKVIFGEKEEKKKKIGNGPLLEGLNQSLEEKDYVPLSEGEANDTFRKEYLKEDQKPSYNDTDDRDLIDEKDTNDSIEENIESEVEEVIENKEGE